MKTDPERMIVISKEYEVDRGRGIEFDCIFIAEYSYINTELIRVREVRCERQILES